jgi:steroid 5-alpha reductase family enzyme
VRGLLDHRDERISAIDLRATAVTALALIVVVLVAFVIQIARGQSGWPYSMLGFVGGLSYVVSVIVLRIRG